MAIDRYLRVRKKRKQSFRPELWLNERERGRLTHWGIEQMITRRTGRSARRDYGNAGRRCCRMKCGAGLQELCS
jgi:hypothetical protein